MSVCIECGDERPGQPGMQVATNRGWADVADWADDLDNATYPALLAFVDHGECHDIPALVADIDGALRDDPPDDPTVVKTLRGLRGFAERNRDEPYLIVGDGFHSGYDDGDGEDDESAEEVAV